MHWLAELETLLSQGRQAVRVSVAQVRGSAPREAGTSMLVTGERCFGTIGGGQLEFQAIARGRSLLSDRHTPAASLARLPLGGDLGQCCGGHVSLIFDRFTPAEDLAAIRQALARLNAGGAVRLRLRIADNAEVERSLDSWAEGSGPRTQLLVADGATRFEEILSSAAVPLWLWGAGHVARAIVRVLEDTTFSLHWLDARSDGFPPVVPASVACTCAPDIASRAPEAPPDAFHLVMTHSHDLDFQIVRSLLSHGRFRWVGLIGSETKATCFRIRLSREGVSDEQILRLTSPIGLAGLSGKAPSTIAIAVAAQLIGQLPASER